jgi:DNA-binding response OmpR family regulator
MLNTILIVDDEPETRKLLATILEDAGYVVEAAEDGKEALNLSKKTPFDMALIDIELPDMKGTQLLALLKKNQPKLVRVIITGHPSVENAITALNEKADAYVLKPINPEKLLRLLKSLLTEKSNEYLKMFREVEDAKTKTPIFKYQHPDRW